MILNIQGVFTGKWLKLRFKVEEEVLQNRLEDDNLFGHDSIEEFVTSNDYIANLEILKRFPDNVEVLEGGRLDILMRTHPRVLQDLSDYRLEKDNLTLLERLIRTLEDIENYPKVKSYIELLISIHNVGDALRILDSK